MSDEEKILNIISNTNYINWLIEFTKNKSNFSDKWLTIANKNDPNKEYVKNLSLFYEGIKNYATNNHIYPIKEDNKHYYTIKYQGISFQIGYELNDGLEYFCNRVPLENESSFIDYYDILSNNKQPNVDEYNNILNNISNMIREAYERNIPIESIVSTLDNVFKEITTKEEERQKTYKKTII